MGTLSDVRRPLNGSTVCPYVGHNTLKEFQLWNMPIIDWLVLFPNADASFYDCLLIGVKFVQCSEYSVAAILVDFLCLTQVTKIHQGTDSDKEFFWDCACNDANDVPLNITMFTARHLFQG